MSRNRAGAIPDLDRARERVARLVESRRVPGAQLVVRWRGEEVHASAHGVARGFRADEGVAPVPVRDDTPFAVFSAGKPVVATAIAILEARGLVDVMRPVAAFVPDFAQHGKAAIRVLDVLTHRSGVLLPALSQQPEVWRDLARVRAALASAVPVYARGTLAYAPLEYGWILGELVERVSGLPFPDFVEREIASPLALPALRFGARGRAHDSIARAYWLGGPEHVAGYDVSRDFERASNGPETLEADLPGSGLVSDARSLAAFYELWLRRGTTPSGARLFPAELADRYLARHALGLDRSNRVPLAVARGFLLGTAWPSAYGWLGTSRCFGHAGAFSTLAFADPDRDLAIAVVTNGNHGRSALLRDLMPVAHAVRTAFPRR